MIEALYSVYLKSRKVTTDSRTITPGCIFFALKGETFDGNMFVEQALENGAAACVTSETKYASDARCFVVADVLATLQALAQYHREHLHIPVVGITGTNGKTTTKELVNAVLSKRYRTFATQGNFNNHLGVPLTLLSIPANTEIAIVEMGANHPGEIEFLCGIAQPDCGLITNCGKAHLEGFGSFEGVVRTKTELYRFLSGRASKEHPATIFVNSDSEVLMNEAQKIVSIPEIPSLCPAYVPNTTPDWNNLPSIGLVTYGGNEEAEVKGHLVGSNPYMKFYFEDDDNVYSVQSHLVGDYNFPNAMAAVAVGLHFRVELFDIKEAIENYEPTNKRSQYKETAHNALFLDCYNANPSSMQVSISNFAALKADNKVVFLGGMKELGEDSSKEHQAIVNRLGACGFSRIILVGPEFEAPAKGMQGIEWFATSADAKDYFADHPIANASILLKGSNSTRMWVLEEVL